VDHFIGMRLGSCVLDRHLGVGGMGAVYLARQERPHRQVAVKVLHPQLMAEGGTWSVFVARFRREADATAALDHTNIIPIHEFGEQDGIAYLVMPYLPDGSLADLLERVGRLPLDAALRYLTQAAAALDYAHSHGIIHRDVKPSNLLLHRDGRLLLADFGLARPVSQSGFPATSLAGAPPDVTQMTDAALTMAGSLMGTPQFMAPEQIVGEPVSAATDIYALGIVAYTLLAGQMPFDGTPPTVILRQQVSEYPVPIRTLRPDLSPQVERVIGWALAKRPAERPASAGAFVAALVQAPRGGGQPSVPAPSYGPPVAAPASMRAGNAPTYSDRRQAAPRSAGRAGASAWPSAAPPPGEASPPARAHPIRVACLSIVATLLVACVGLGVLSAAQHGHNTGRTGGPAAGNGQGATPTQPSMATSVVNWLSVAPDNVRLGCGAAKSVTVVLRNSGPQETWWSVTVAPWGSLSVDPLFSALPSKNSVTITLTNTTYAAFGSGHTGTVTFGPSVTTAGKPAVVHFATRAC
jgi:serine/threonine protein kinase